MTCPELEAALDARPADGGLRLVYADWFQERGEDDRATFLRLMARHGRRPWYQNDAEFKTKWRWFAGGRVRLGPKSDESVIANRILALVPRLPDVSRVRDEEEWSTAEGRLSSDDSTTFHLTRQSAEAALFAAWVAAGKPEGLG